MIGGGSEECEWVCFECLRVCEEMRKGWKRGFLGGGEGVVLEG